MFAKAKPTPLPLYFKVMMNLKEKIVSGEWLVGRQIPGEIGLARDLGVSVITMRQALAHLVDEGYLRREQGRGSFVMWQGPLRQSIDLNINARKPVPLDREAEFKFVSIEKAWPTPNMKERLQLKDDEPIGKIVRVRIQDKQPLAYICSYLPYHIASRLPHKQLSRLSLANAIEAFSSTRITDVKHTIGAVIADDELASHIGITAGSSVLLIERDYYSKKENVLVSIGRYRTDLFRYELTLPVNPIKKRSPWRHSSWVKKGGND